MRPVLLITAAVASLLLAAPVSAQPAPTVAVTVSIGPKLQEKAHDYGASEFDRLASDLKDQVMASLRHSRGPTPARVDLVIENAVPNHPTFAQLGRTEGLTLLSSRGLGGASVSGVVTYTDGSQHPIRSRFYETDLRNDRGVDTWGDADTAFDFAASDIAKGRFSDKYEGPGATGSGHFGYPFIDQ